jgi:sodium-independent sulfate anion transporter 11
LDHPYAVLFLSCSVLDPQGHALRHYRKFQVIFGFDVLPTSNILEQIMAVFHLISPWRIFYRYYRMSFVDFVASMLGFWVTLFTSTEIGLATSVGFNIVVTLLRLAFPRWIGLSKIETEANDWKVPHPQPDARSLDVPPEAFYVRFTDDLLFPNAERLKAAIVESVKIRYEPHAHSIDLKSKDRSWNVSDLKKIPKLRRRQGITPFTADTGKLHHVVLDLGMVTFMDITGCLSLIELKMELRRYIGKELQFRFIGMNDTVRERFTRAEWEFTLEGEPRREGYDIIYASLETALSHTDEYEKGEIVAEKSIEV